MTDYEYLESSYHTLFKFEKQVNLQIFFQRFDEVFSEFVDLEPDEELSDFEKLNVVVFPILVMPPTVYFLLVLFRFC